MKNKTLNNAETLRQKKIATNILKRIKSTETEDKKYYYLLTNWWFWIREEPCYSPKFIETNCSPLIFEEIWSFIYDLDRLIYENPLENEDYIESIKIIFYFLDELGFTFKTVLIPAQIPNWIRLDSYERKQMEVIVDNFSIDYQMSKGNWSISQTTLTLLIKALKKLYNESGVQYQEQEISKLFQSTKKPINK